MGPDQSNIPMCSNVRAEMAEDSSCSKFSGITLKCFSIATEEVFKDSLISHLILSVYLCKKHSSVSPLWCIDGGIHSEAFWSNA